MEGELLMGEREGSWKMVYCDDGIAPAGFYFVNAGESVTYSKASKESVFHLLHKLVELNTAPTPHPNAVAFEAMVDEKGFMTGDYNCIANDDVDHSGQYYSAAQVAGLAAATKRLADLTYKYDNDTKPSMITVKFSLLEAARAALSLAPAPQDDAAELRKKHFYMAEQIVRFMKDDQPSSAQEMAEALMADLEAPR